MKKEYSKKGVIEFIADFSRYATTHNKIERYAIEEGLLEEELEKGVWYKCRTEIAARCGECETFVYCTQPYFNGEDADADADAEGIGYGFDYLGEWCNRVVMFNSVIATKKEIEPLLIAEAKKRGLVEGVDIEDAKGRGRRTLENNYNGFYFRDNDFFRGGACIYDNGKWATPIQSTEMTLEQVCKELGKTIKIIK